jgi:hypothetical protein
MFHFCHLKQTRRQLGAWMLCALLVLLPLRGWAQTTMHLAGPIQALAVLVQTSAADASAPVASTAQLSQTSPWTPPCHAAMDEVPGVPAVSSDGCSLCSLCHASALCASEVCVSHGGASLAAPSAARAGHRAPELALPERPPRV